MSKQVAIYARVSTDGQTTDNQLHELRAVVERMGWEIVHEFVENGVSGAKGRDQRPEFDSLCKAAVRRADSDPRASDAHDRTIDGDAFADAHG